MTGAPPATVGGAARRHDALSFLSPLTHQPERVELRVGIAGGLLNAALLAHPADQLSDAVFEPHARYEPEEVADAADVREAMPNVSCAEPARDLEAACPTKLVRQKLCDP